MMRAVRLIRATVVYATTAAALTWPLSAHLASTIVSHDDVLFSIWRLAWIAHQLRSDPVHLFDANIFFPARDTLAFSDAMLLQGLIGSPMIWARLHPLLVHNLLLVVGLIGSALGAYVLCSSVTRVRSAAVVGGLIFGFAPYRFAHIGHLELLWTVWMPLALLALVHLWSRPSVRSGVLLGALVAAQFLSSIYYGVFLCLYLVVAAFVLTASGSPLGPIPDSDTDRAADPQPEAARTVWKTRLGALVLAGAVSALVVGPYFVPYARARATVGSRSDREVSEHSAVPADYLRVPDFNRVAGHTLMGRAGTMADERTLFPGATALALCLVALWPRPSRSAVFCAALLVFAADLSLGANGLTFSLLRTAVPPLQGLRAPARAGVLALLSISVLAALGTARLLQAGIVQRWPRGALAVGIGALCLVEYCSAPLPTRSPALVPTPEYTWLAKQPAETVVVELPVPRPSAMWLYETQYQYASIFHWRRLVNGYSGFAPPQHVRTLELLEAFPDEASVARLRDIGVDFVFVHKANYERADQYGALLSALSGHPAFVPRAVFGGMADEVAVFEVVNARRQVPAAESTTRR